MEPMPVDEQRKCAILPLTEQTWPEGTIPLVSVFSWVYNHAAFIRESIDSILTQQTDFPVEIILHDDASTDGTAEIIAEYAQRYPRLFRNVMHSKNQYSRGNCLLKPLTSVPKGKYIALTHGDDFWTHPLKLFRQKVLLEQTPDVVLCGHRFRLASATSMDSGSVSGEEPEVGGLPDVLLRNYVHTASAMFRNGLLSEKDLVDPPDAGDWFIWIQLLKHGKVAFINDVMSGYRIHSGGVSSGLPLRRRLSSVTRSVDRLHRDFGGQFSTIRRQSLALYRLQLSASCLLWGWNDVAWGLMMLSSAFVRSPILIARQPLTVKILIGVSRRFVRVVMQPFEHFLSFSFRTLKRIFRKLQRKIA